MVKQGYKQTQIGVIPEDWEVLKFCEHFHIYAGGDVPKTSLSKFITDKYCYPIYANALHNKGLYGYTELHRSKGNAVTVTARGAIGYAEYRYRPFFPIVRLLVMEPHGLLDPRFTTYTINNRIQFAIESTGVPQLTAPQIGNYCIGAPAKIEEQKTIADALSDVDGLIVSLEKLIAKKRDIKMAIMQKLLTSITKQLNKCDNGRKIIIGKDAYLKARIGWQALTTKEYLQSGDYQLVTGTDFEGGRINWEGCWFIDKWRYSQDKNIQLNNNDVLLTKDGTIGKVAYVEDLKIPAALNNGVFVIRPINNSFHQKYMYYVLSSRIFHDFLDEITAGSTINHLYQKDFIKFTFFAPCYEEQESISQILSDIDFDINKLEIRLIKTKAIKQGMMQELLTGRTRLI